MTEQDPFIIGLRAIFAGNESLKPATISAAAKLNKAAIRKMLDGQVRSPRHDSAVKIAAALGMTVAEVIARGNSVAPVGPTIAVAGRVGAGAVVHLYDDHAKGDGLYHVLCPPQVSPSGIVGVEVTGDSMTPVYQPGDVLLYTRQAMGVPTEAIDRICVAQDDQGRVWVKQVRMGSAPGLFNLLSANPTGQNLHDQRLTWAAPVRLHLPAEFVQRVPPG